MSKKSRRRNRRLLALAALAGTAALGARGKANQMSGQETVSDAQKATQLGSRTINKLAASPVIKPISGNTFRTRHRITDSAGNTIAGVHRNRGSKRAGALMNQRSAMNKVPPSMRGGAKYAEGATTFMPGNRQWPGGYVEGVFKSGGRVKKARVTGIAKRGFGRALMKGKR